MTADRAFYRSLPKVDLHRHLEGSLRLSTLLEIGRAYGLTTPRSPRQLRSLVQVQKKDPLNYQNFLAKFATLRLFYRSPEILQRITREAIEDAARDNVRHLELRFTPVALGRAEGFPLGEVMDWVCASARQAAADCGISVSLLASVNRHEPPQLAEEVVTLAIERRAQGLAGVDLAGNEADFPAEPFIAILHAARQAGLRLTVHAGEWGGAANVRQAIELFAADRIGHGVRVLEDPNVVALARERQTVFEVCLTSNYQSGVIAPGRVHPIVAMLEAGLNVTLASDDPAISQITLSDEYRLACDTLRLPLVTLCERILAAVRASFLPPTAQERLYRCVKTELEQIIESRKNRYN